MAFLGAAPFFTAWLFLIRYSLHKELQQEGEGYEYQLAIHDPYLPLILYLKYFSLAVH